ncbi:MAG: SidA/IucD/PvdA family monooxygenase, partial [Burkholderiales bacterium]
LQRERVDNVLIIDRAERGREGPWRSYARMPTLRSWKTVTGPDLGVPSLTFQSWFEAQWGADEFERLNKIPTTMWHDYLLWIRDVLALQVKNEVELLAVQPHGGLLRATLKERGIVSDVIARKVVLAMGIERSGRWWMPSHIEALPPRFRAHTSDDIDFQALAGKRIAVLGAGASAFDNAAVALESGAAHVSLFCRRASLQRVQPFKAISYPGYLRHFGDLDDPIRWKWMRHLLPLREALPVETWQRVTRHHNFSLHTGSPWNRVEVTGNAVRIETPRGVHEADFLIVGTGIVVDMRERKELGDLTLHVATWSDRFTPAHGDEDAWLSSFPYLGPGFELIEKAPGAAPCLANIHVFDFGATMSLGPSGASVNAMKFAVPRLVGKITRDLFREDLDHHFQALIDYDEPEFPLTFARDAKP